MISPTVSILVPVYNQKQYIAECIQSALNQTFTDFQIVIVDNASDDGTWEICQQFAANDSRIRAYRNEENIGPVRNWKRCAEEAKGEFSKILFSDDMLEPGCLAEMVPKLKNPDVSFVFCAARCGKSREESILAYSHNVKERLSAREFLNLILDGKAPVSPGAMLIRTKDLQKNLHFNFPTATARPFEKHGAGPDVMIMLLTAETYPSVCSIKSPLVYFRAHSGSFTIKNENMQVFDGYVSAISYYLSKNESSIELVKYLAKQWVSRIRISRSLISPKKFVVGNNGPDSLLSVVLIVVLIIVFSTTCTFRKIVRMTSARVHAR